MSYPETSLLMECNIGLQTQEQQAYPRHLTSANNPSDSIHVHYYVRIIYSSLWKGTKISLPSYM